MNNVEKIKPTGLFTNYIYKAIPLAFDESMSYYETLCGLLSYLKDTVIPTVNNNADAVAELQTLYEELKTYVDDYFNDLDVQEEINNKLDEMVTDGTFTRLINNELLGNINQRILTNTNNIANLQNTTLKSNETNMITMQMLSQEVKESITGGSTAVVGLNSVSNENIMNNTIDIINLNDKLKNTLTKNYEKIEIPKNLQGFISVWDNAIHINQNTGYVYGVVNLDNNSIYELTTRNYYDMVGIAVTDSNDNLIWSSKPQTQDTIGELFTITFRTNQTGLKAYISFRDINDYIENYGYLYKYGEITNNISVKSSMLLVEDMNNKYLDKGHHSTPVFIEFDGGNIKKYKLSQGTKYIVKSANLYSICGFIITDEKNNTIYESSTEAQPTLQNVEYNFIANDNGYIFISNVPNLNINSNVEIYEENIIKTGYENKTWYAVGDSLTDASTLGNNDNYVNLVSDKLKINSINGGNGGSGYHKRITSNQAFYQLINNSNVNPDIITIFGSFNDMYDENGDLITIDAIGDVNDDNTNTICGCINQAINSITSKYPNTLIGIITPTPWRWFNYSNQYEVANTYVNKIIEICKLKSIPCLDLFHQSNLRPWDANFREQYYLDADGVHPNTIGHKRFSNEITEFIKSILY